MAVRMQVQVNPAVRCRYRHAPCRIEGDMVSVTREEFLVHQAAPIVEHPNGRRTRVGGGKQLAVRRPRQTLNVTTTCIKHTSECIALEIEQINAVGATLDSRGPGYRHSVVAGNGSTIQPTDLI